MGSEYPPPGSTDSLDVTAAAAIATTTNPTTRSSPTTSSRNDDDLINEPLLRELESQTLSSTPQVHQNVSKASLLLPPVANMSNSILGAGIVGLPYALSLAGLVPGILLLVILGIATDWTLSLVLLNAKLAGTTSYIGFVHVALGKYGRAAVSFFQFAFAFGGMAAFSLIIGDTIPHVLQSLMPSLDFLFTRTSVLVVFTLALSYPLSLFRKIDKLSHASTFALISMCVIITTVAIRGPSISSELKGDPEIPLVIFSLPGMFQAIGVISFAFVCHHNSMLIYESLKIPTIDAFSKVTHVSTILSVLASMTMAISGFISFREKTVGNVLNNFSPDDFWINIARLCFGLNMVTTIPLECFVCREVIEACFFDGKPLSTKMHLVVTTTLIFTSLFISLLTCDLGLVLEIAGGFAASSISYIFPAVSYLVLTSGSNAPKDYEAIDTNDTENHVLFSSQDDHSLDSAPQLSSSQQEREQQQVPNSTTSPRNSTSSTLEPLRFILQRNMAKKRSRTRILAWISTIFGFSVMILSTTITLLRSRDDSQKTCS